MVWNIPGPPDPPSDPKDADALINGLNGILWEMRNLRGEWHKFNNVFLELAGRLEKCERKLGLYCGACGAPYPELNEAKNERVESSVGVHHGDAHVGRDLETEQK